jgi:hypothetical protein
VFQQRTCSQIINNFVNIDAKNNNMKKHRRYNKLNLEIKWWLIENRQECILFITGVLIVTACVLSYIIFNEANF